jgi:hypothetical protein
MLNGKIVKYCSKLKTNKQIWRDQGEAGRIKTKMRTERKNKRREEMKLEEMSLAYLQFLRQLPEDWCFLTVFSIIIFECATALR